MEEAAWLVDRLVAKVSAAPTAAAADTDAAAVISRCKAGGGDVAAAVRAELERVRAENLAMLDAPALPAVVPATHPSMTALSQAVQTPPFTALPPLISASGRRSRGVLPEPAELDPVEAVHSASAALSSAAALERVVQPLVRGPVVAQCLYATPAGPVVPGWVEVDDHGLRVYEPRGCHCIGWDVVEGTSLGAPARDPDVARTLGLSTFAPAPDLAGTAPWLPRDVAAGHRPPPTAREYATQFYRVVNIEVDTALRPKAAPQSNTAVVFVPTKSEPAPDMHSSYSLVLDSDEDWVAVTTALALRTDTASLARHFPALLASGAGVVTGSEEAGIDVGSLPGGIGDSPTLPRLSFSTELKPLQLLQPLKDTSEALQRILADLDTKEMQFLCAWHIPMLVYCVLRQAVLDDPLRRWATVTDIAACLPVPLQGLDAVRAMALADFFVGRGWLRREVYIVS